MAIAAGLVADRPGDRSGGRRHASAKGNGKSLGPRSAETENTYEKFTAGKARAEARLKATTARLTDQAQLNNKPDQSN